jgi:hypothetical protein
MMKTSREYKTGTSVKHIQLWPDGKSITYRIDHAIPSNGDYPEEVYKVKKNNRWKKATKEEYRQIRIEELAEMYAERDILCCDSSLVDDLVKSSFESTSEVSKEFCIDEWQNVYIDTTDWTAKKCREYCDDNRIDYPTDSNPFNMEKDEIVEWLDILSVIDEKKAQRKNIQYLQEQLFLTIDKGDWGNVKDWRMAVQENAGVAEPYEWWRVTSWLCRKLSDIGEVVIDNNYGCWWGRCATGQGLIMDGVLQKIAAEFV